MQLARCNQAHHNRNFDMSLRDCNRLATRHIFFVFRSFFRFFFLDYQMHCDGISKQLEKPGKNGAKKLRKARSCSQTLTLTPA